MSAEQALRSRTHLGLPVDCTATSLQNELKRRALFVRRSEVQRIQSFLCSEPRAIVIHMLQL